MSESSGEETDPVNNDADMANVQATLPFFSPFVPDSDPALRDPVGPNGSNVLKTS